MTLYFILRFNYALNQTKFSCQTKLPHQKQYVISKQRHCAEVEGVTLKLWPKAERTFWENLYVIFFWKAIDPNNYIHLLGNCLKKQIVTDIKNAK